MLEFSARMQDRIRSDMGELSSSRARLDKALAAKQAQQEGIEVADKDDGADGKVHPPRTESPSASLRQA